MDNIQTADETDDDQSAAEASSSPVVEDKPLEKWRHFIAKFQTQKLSSDEAVDFFKSPTGIRCDAADVNGDESAQREATENARSSTDVVQLCYQPAFYQPPSLKGLIVFSSKSPVTLEEKLEDITQVWSPEEDGLYIGYPPEYDRQKWMMFERRLLRTSHKKWFRSDGSVAVLPDPLRPYHIRNIVPPPEESLRPAFMPSKAGRGGVDGQDLEHAYPLHIFISGLHFDHHWLFGAENVLANQLWKKWHTFCQERQDTCNRMDILVRKLRALYQAHDAAIELLERLQLNDADGNIISAQAKRIDCYRESIRWTRDECYTVSTEYRKAVQSLVSDWKRLKEIRKAQGFQSTGFKLVVKKVDAEDEQLDWDEEISRQMDEARRLFQQDARREANRYKKEKAQWKAKRKRLRKEKQSQHELEETEEEEPEAPQKRRFDEESTRAQILKRMKEALLPPGDQPIKLSLESAPASTTNNPKEQRRIEAISRHQYQIKILFNGQETAISDVFRLTPESDFTAGDVQQSFHLWIRKKPHSLSLQLSCRSHSNHKKMMLLTEIPVPIPLSQISFSTLAPSELEFSSPIVQPALKDLGTVGCGHQKDGEEVAFTHGSIAVKTGWGTDASGRILAPNLFHLQQKKKPTGKEMQEWIDQAHLLDPNDPANADTFDKFHKIKGLEWRGRSDGSDDPAVVEDDEQMFCSADELDSNIRFKLLRRRADEIKHFSHLAMIPSRPAEVPQHLVQLVENGSIMESHSSRLNVEDESSNKLDRIRQQGQRKLHNILSFVSEKLSSVSKKKLQLSDLVMQDHIPDMSSFSGELMPLLFKAHRPLRPERKERNLTPLLAALAIQINEPIRLRVNVIRASNVPRQIDRDETSTAGGPFVQVSFQKSSARTSTANGPNPTWNQELFLPVQLAEGFRSLAHLQSVTDDLFIQLFDEVVVDVLDDDRQRDVSIHQRFERHWLGSLQIPFQVIFRWNKLEGTFALNIPLIPPGYQCDRSTNQAIGPLLTVLISVHPAVSPPRPDQVIGPSTEEASFLDYIIEWKTDLVKDFPHLNNVSPLVVNEQAMTVYIGRYLTPLNPPEEVVGSSEEETLENVTQFVAAIPSLINYFNPSLPRIWLTSKAILDGLAARGEEKAVLLHNYLLALKYEVYLVLGMSIPEGETGFVLCKDKTATNTFWMINPSTGSKTNVRDSNCPMQQVWALINGSDFWVNVQPRCHPSQMQFSQMTTKTSGWKSLFHRGYPNPHSVGEIEDYQYATTNSEDVRNLEKHITDHLKDSFMTWRKTSRTKWNRHASHVFRDILILNQETTNTSVLPSSEKLEELLMTYKVFGVGLRFTEYTTKESISDCLYATGLHLHSGVEFALAVLVEPFPHSLIRVSIYCASLDAM